MLIKDLIIALQQEVENNKKVADFDFVISHEGGIYDTCDRIYLIKAKNGVEVENKKPNCVSIGTLF